MPEKHLRQQRNQRTIVENNSRWLFNVFNYLRHHPIESLIIFLMLVGRVNTQQTEQEGTSLTTQSPNPLSINNGAMNYKAIQNNLYVRPTYPTTGLDYNSSPSEEAFREHLMHVVVQEQYDRAVALENKFIKAYPTEKTYGFLIGLKYDAAMSGETRFAENINEIYNKLPENPVTYEGVVGQALYLHLNITQYGRFDLLNKARMKFEQAQKFIGNANVLEKELGYKEKYNDYTRLETNFFQSRLSRYTISADVNRFNQLLIQSSGQFCEINSIHTAMKYSLPIIIASDTTIVPPGGSPYDIIIPKNGAMGLIYNSDENRFYMYLVYVENDQNIKFVRQINDIIIDNVYEILDKVLAIVTPTSKLIENDEQFIKFLPPNKETESEDKALIALVITIIIASFGIFVGAYERLFKKDKPNLNNRNVAINEPELALAATTEPLRADSINITNSSQKKTKISPHKKYSNKKKTHNINESKEVLEQPEYIFASLEKIGEFVLEIKEGIYLIKFNRINNSHEISEDSWIRKTTNFTQVTLDPTETLEVLRSNFIKEFGENFTFENNVIFVERDKNIITASAVNRVVSATIKELINDSKEATLPNKCEKLLNEIRPVLDKVSLDLEECLKTFSPISIWLQNNQETIEVKIKANSIPNKYSNIFERRETLFDEIDELNRQYKELDKYYEDMSRKFSNVNLLESRMYEFEELFNKLRKPTIELKNRIIKLKDDGDIIASNYGGPNVFDNSTVLKATQEEIIENDNANEGTSEENSDYYGYNYDAPEEVVDLDGLAVIGVEGIYDTKSHSKLPLQKPTLKTKIVKPAPKNISPSKAEKASGLLPLSEREVMLLAYLKKDRHIPIIMECLSNMHPHDQLINLCNDNYTSQLLTNNLSGIIRNIQAFSLMRSLQALIPFINRKRHVIQRNASSLHAYRLKNVVLHGIVEWLSKPNLVTKSCEEFAIKFESWLEAVVSQKPHTLILKAGTFNSNNWVGFIKNGRFEPNYSSESVGKFLNEQFIVLNTLGNIAVSIPLESYKKCQILQTAIMGTICFIGEGLNQLVKSDLRAYKNYMSLFGVNKILSATDKNGLQISKFRVCRNRTSHWKDKAMKANQNDIAMVLDLPVLPSYDVLYEIATSITDERLLNEIIEIINKKYTKFSIAENESLGFTSKNNPKGHEDNNENSSSANSLTN